MATAQEILELIIKVQGTDEGKKLEAMLAKVDAGVDSTKGKVAGMGQSFLQTGRIVQDFAQGGFAGIINNIEGFTQAIGLGPGAAGVMTVLGTAAFLAMPKIKEFIASFDTKDVKNFTSQLDELQKKIKEIEDRPTKLGVDVQDLESARVVLEQINDALKEARSLSESQSKFQKESAAEVQKVLEEAAGGGAGVKAAMRGAMIPGMEAEAIKSNVAEEKHYQAELDKINKDLAAAVEAGISPDDLAAFVGQQDRLTQTIEDLQKQRDAIITDVRKQGGRVDQEIGRLISEAKTGGETQEAGVKALADQLRRAKRPDVAAALMGVTPEAIKVAGKDAQKAAEEAAKESARAYKEAADEVWDFVEKEFDRDMDEFKDAFKAGAVAEKAGGKEEGAALAAEAKRTEKAIDAETAGLLARFAKPRQAQYEGTLAGSARIAAMGGPVARTPAEERGFRQAGGQVGVDYALPPGVLERRARGQMAREFKGGGAGEQAANLAAEAIAGKGEQDVARLMDQLVRNQVILANRVLQIGPRAKQANQAAVGVERMMQQNQQGALPWDGR